MCKLHLTDSFSPSVQVLSYMICMEVFVPCLDVYVEANPIQIEVLRRSENDPVVAESY